MSLLFALVIFIFSVIGMTQIIVDSDMPLVAWVRDRGTKLLDRLPGNWSKVFSCYQCCGTWCGFFCAVCLFPFNIPLIFLSGCAGGFLAQWGTLYLDYLQARSLIELKKGEEGE